MSTLEKKINAPEIIVKKPVEWRGDGTAPAFSLEEAMDARQSAHGAGQVGAHSHEQRRRVRPVSCMLAPPADELAALLSRECGKTLTNRNLSRSFR
jgi:acyl-CoA reductase-like NAD-dependent aldehyde dehydrogenase